MSYIILKQNSYPIEEWTGGDTIEIIKFPVSSTFKEKNFDLRISKAQLFQQHSLFTQLPEHTRKLVSLSGGVRLTHDENNATERSIYLNRYDVDSFDGNFHTQSYGSGSDYNLIYKDFIRPHLQIIKDKENIHIALDKNEFFIIYASADLCDIELKPKNEYLHENITLSKDETLIIQGETMDITFIKATWGDINQTVAITCLVDFDYNPQEALLFTEHYEQFNAY